MYTCAFVALHVKHTLHSCRACLPQSHFVQLQVDLMHLLQPACAVSTLACFDLLFQPAGRWQHARGRSSTDNRSRPQTAEDAKTPHKKTPSDVAKRLTEHSKLHHHAGGPTHKSPDDEWHSCGARSERGFSAGPHHSAVMECISRALETNLKASSSSLKLAAVTLSYAQLVAFASCADHAPISLDHTTLDQESSLQAVQSFNTHRVRGARENTGPTTSCLTFMSHLPLRPDVCLCMGVLQPQSARGMTSCAQSAAYYMTDHTAYCLSDLTACVSLQVAFIAGAACLPLPALPVFTCVCRSLRCLLPMYTAYTVLTKNQRQGMQILR